LPVEILQVSGTVNPYEIFMRPLCLPDAQKPRLGSFAVAALRCNRQLRRSRKMLAVIFVVSCLLVFGFYVYVLVHLRREERREDAHKKRLPEHFYEMGPERHQDNAESHQDTDFLGTSIRRNSEAKARLRRETMVGVGLTVGGLAAVLAGIEFLNSLVSWLHWY
jgi:hypothetical protein